VSETAEVVVIGAGIAGVTAAYELQSRGIDDVVVVERDGMGSGTTKFGAGSIGLWAKGYVPSWGDEVLDIERYTLDFYRGLAEDGAEFGYTSNGALWFASSTEVLEKKVLPILRNGADENARALDPAEVEEASRGFIKAAEVVGGVFYPSCAQVTAPRAACAVGERFHQRGGRLELRRPVEQLLVRDGKVTGVRTARGDIEAGTVVLAAGAWNNQLLAEHELSIPHAPLVLSRLVTEPLEEVPTTLPFCFGPEYSGLWLRPYEGRLLWGCAYSDPVRYFFLDRPVPERFDEIPVDAYETLRAVGAKVSAAAPMLGRTDISAMFQQGVPCYTADAHAIVGRIPEIEGLYVSGGDNEAGVSHAPGHGRLLAEAIEAGTDVAARTLRPERFAGEALTAADVVERMAANEDAYFA
jgi:sarcosine oxidase subunit beta